MAQGRLQDAWAVGHEYELYFGRCSRVLARRFLEWLGAPGQADWLEVGIATGLLTQPVLETYAPRSVFAVDREQGLPGTPREHFSNPIVHARQGDPAHLPLRDAVCDAAVSALVLSFLPDPAAALAELRRAVRPGGLVAGYLWDYAGRMDVIRIFWDAAAALDPAAQEAADAARASGLGEDALVDLWNGAGLLDVQTHRTNVSMVFPNFETFWRPFLGGQGPAPTYCVALSKRDREALRQRVSDALPIQEDGSINLIARALMVRGVVG